MATALINFNLEQQDDPILPDGIPSWEGGDFSNWRANLLKANQSKRLVNCDVDRLGKLRTRRGTIQLGAAAINPGHIIQGLSYFQTAAYNYVVAASNKNLYAFDGANWNLIAQGGCVDDDAMVITRTGQINNASGYNPGDVTLVVDTMVGVVGNGDTLYFLDDIKRSKIEYFIASHSETVGNTTTIVLEQNGLQAAVLDNARFVVLRTANINNVAGYPAGTTTVAIDNYTGVVNNGEYFVILSEGVRHVITGHSETGGNTTSLTFTAGLTSPWQANSDTNRITFAQGVDKLYFCDGVGNIFAWNGATTMQLSGGHIVDWITGSVYVQNNTLPPSSAKILVWFQNRLIAAGIPGQPADAIMFSDFLDPNSWDSDFQQVRVGGGDSDPITGIVPWTDLSLIVFKKSSIYVIDCDPSQNPDPTDPTLLVSSYTIRKIHSNIGCPAPLTAKQVGGASSTPGSDVFFLDSDKKLRSIRRTMAAEFQQELVGDISQPKQDVFDRINLATIANATAQFHNGHYIISLPVDGATYPNITLPYHVHTQSWCGEWTGWLPTYYSIRTDIGDYVKMTWGGSDGKVYQWLDDIALQDELTSTYQDAGVDIPTYILTRAITFGDPFNFKTGLSVELEFDESVAPQCNVVVIVDGVPSPVQLAPAFTTLSAPRLTLPFVIPVTLPASPGLLRKAFDLQRYGSWRELQFAISTAAGKLSIRSIRVTGFMDTIRLQTNPQLPDSA